MEIVKVIALIGGFMYSLSIMGFTIFIAMTLINSYTERREFKKASTKLAKEIEEYNELD